MLDLRSLVLIVGLRIGRDIVAIEKCLGPMLTQPTFPVLAPRASCCKNLIYRRSFQAVFAFFHGRPSRTIAFKMTMSLRMAAVMTTLKGLPRARRLAVKATMMGLDCMATRAAMYRHRRTAALPASIWRGADNFPLSRLMGARPASRAASPFVSDPSSGMLASSVAAVTGPTPITLLMSLAFLSKGSWVRIKSAISASRASKALRRLTMWTLMLLTTLAVFEPVRFRHKHLLNLIAPGLQIFERLLFRP